MNNLTNVFTNIRNNARVGNRSFIQHYHSKFVRNVLAKMVQYGYLRYVREVPRKKNEHSGIYHLEIGISPTLNYCSGISPQFFIKHTQIEDNEKLYLPAVEIGILIFSTTRGIMTNQEIRESKENLGGKILGYVY